MKNKKVLCKTRPPYDLEIRVKHHFLQNFFIFHLNGPQIAANDAKYNCTFIPHSPGFIQSSNKKVVGSEK